MPADVTIPTGLLLGFLLVLVRVAGIFIFVPLPGIRSTPEPVRAALVLGIALAMFPRWPVLDVGVLSTGRMAGWILAEAGLGIGIGLAVAVVLEAFAVGTQILGLQAGYAYASTIDPTTDADSGVLLVFAQLGAGMLFFASGLDRELLRAVALSLERTPPGGSTLSIASAEAIIRLAGGMFSIGLRVALPVVALLILVDLALALLGRLNSQLQLLSLAFPIKMLATLAMLAIGAALFPRLLREYAGTAWPVVHHLLGI